MNRGKVDEETINRVLPVKEPLATISSPEQVELQQYRSMWKFVLIEPLVWCIAALGRLLAAFMH